MEPLHSRLGIASFVMAMLIMVAMILMFIVAGVMASSSGGELDEESPAAIMIGFAIIGLLFADVVALVLGISSLFESQ